MSEKKLDILLSQFTNAVQRLDDVLQQPEDEYMRDSAIQRFEFTFDLSWKLLKVFLDEQHGVVCASPKSCFREAYKQQIIEYSDTWITMTDDRNNTVHTYNSELAKKIYDTLPQALQHFQKLLKTITTTLKQ